MRRMADSVVAKNCPPGFPLYLGYINGQWPSYFELTKLYPNAVHVPCTVTAHVNAGTVLDVEAGDATPDEAPPWVQLRRSAGYDPTVYCSLSAWPAVRAAFTRAGVPQPHYLVAGYATPPDPTIPAGAIGHQFIDHGPYDESVVADYWPGVDPLHTVPITPPPGHAWSFQMAEVRTTLVMVGQLDPKGRGFQDWNPGFGRDPVIVGFAKQGPDPTAGSADDKLGDPYWEKQGDYDVKISPRGGAARVVVTGGQPGSTVGVYVSVA